MVLVRNRRKLGFTISPKSSTLTILNYTGIVIVLLADNHRMGVTSFLARGVVNLYCIDQQLLEEYTKSLPSGYSNIKCQFQIRMGGYHPGLVLRKGKQKRGDNVFEVFFNNFQSPTTLLSLSIRSVISNEANRNNIHWLPRNLQNLLQPIWGCIIFQFPHYRQDIIPMVVRSQFGEHIHTCLCENRQLYEYIKEPWSREYENSLLRELFRQRRLERRNNLIPDA